MAHPTFDQLSDLTGYGEQVVHSAHEDSSGRLIVDDQALPWTAELSGFMRLR